MKNVKRGRDDIQYELTMVGQGFFLLQFKQTDGSGQQKNVINQIKWT